MKQIALEPVLTFTDQFISRSASFQNPDHRLALSKTGPETDLALPLTLTTLPQLLLWVVNSKWTIFDGGGDRFKGSVDEDDAYTPTLLSSHALDPQDGWHSVLLPLR